MIYILTLLIMTSENNACSLKSFFEDFHYIIPLRHKWWACFQEMIPLASKLFGSRTKHHISTLDLVQPGFSTIDPITCKILTFLQKKYRNQNENNACTRHLWKSRLSYLGVHPQIWYGRFSLLKKNQHAILSKSSWMSTSSAACSKFTINV